MGDPVLVLLTPQGSFLLSEFPVAGVYGSGATHSPDGSFLSEVKSTFGKQNLEMRLLFSSNIYVYSIWMVVC